jgi:hypothetical protein
MRHPTAAFAVVLVCCWSRLVHSYRVGEAIDTDIRLDYDVSDALRSQMPLFGIDSAALFSMPSMLNQSATFALTFEDGLWTTGAMPLVNKNKEYLQSWQVDLMFSRYGSLQSVSYQAPIYTTDEPKFFQVDYKFHLEEAAHVTAALTVMCMAVFAMSVYFVLEACGMTPEGYNGDDRSSGWEGKQHNG